LAEDILLEVKDIRAGYGAAEVLHSVSLKVLSGACVCLLGANGAGKTTTLSAICGLVPVRSGTVFFGGEDITKKSADAIVRAGISLVPEGRWIVSSMSVEENLLVGGYSRKDKDADADLNAIYSRFPRLEERRWQYAGSLSGGEQQMLAVGRALMARPRLLILDEPSMGLAPQIVSAIFEIIREINRSGTSVLLVEQNARKALSIAAYGYVMENGRIELEGSAPELLSSPRVIEAYLGVG
jgi:branched-chain amino acid transport system ATP-binding protein